MTAARALVAEYRSGELGLEAFAASSSARRLAASSPVRDLLGGELRGAAARLPA